METEEQAADEALNPLVAIVARLSNQKFLAEMLLQFSEKVIENADVTGQPSSGPDSRQTRVDMPVNLILMTPYFEFNLFDMP